MIVAPHTSNMDFVIGLAFRSLLRLTHIRFLGKKELFKLPFGFIFRMLGGTPVDRFSKHNMVDQVVTLFNSNDKFAIALSPEGTRKKVNRLRTGFYHIAKKAGVPVVMIGLDYSKKLLIVSDPFYATSNEAADFNHIINFFGPLKGKNPELGMGHMMELQQDT